MHLDPFWPRVLLPVFALTKLCPVFFVKLDFLAQIGVEKWNLSVWDLQKFGTWSHN